MRATWPSSSPATPKEVTVWASREEEAKALAETTGRVPRAATRATFHLRRYMPLYAFATVWVTIAALVPTVGGSGGTTAAAGRVRSSAGALDSGSALGADTGTTLPGGAGGPASGPAGGGGRSARGGAASGGGPIGAVQA